MGRRAPETAATSRTSVERERAEVRLLPARWSPESGQSKSPGVPFGSRRSGAATGVTATAIVFMASSFG